MSSWSSPAQLKHHSTFVQQFKAVCSVRRQVASISWFPNLGCVYSVRVRHWPQCVVSCQAHSPSIIRLITGFQQNGQ
ncbi:hypothetical protein SCLCIDRAFT_1209230 [Scleroderma citrinum Foug A]|uniref:Uncharacterized protein n=1 Tax=Scleroderma citrinum Foug A TaxID=1036808 RepID=A0A0C3E6I0_9AGAM|nr:hypothetical protein SCLCIDRAFT_1209230 [Scleroderma citrinum Foug A]